MSDHKINFQGYFSAEHWRNGVCIGVHSTHNDIMRFGKVRLLEKVFFPTRFPPLTWYIGCIDGKTYINTTIFDRLAQPLGWTEFSQYILETETDPTNRAVWEPDDTAAIGSLINSVKSTDIKASEEGSVIGIFITDKAEFGINGGTLWATAILDNAINLYTDDILKLTYRISLSNDLSFDSDQGLAP